jgi:hypothetical protein
LENRFNDGVVQTTLSSDTVKVLEPATIRYDVFVRGGKTVLFPSIDETFEGLSVVSQRTTNDLPVDAEQQAELSKDKSLQRSSSKTTNQLATTASPDSWRIWSLEIVVESLDPNRFEITPIDIQSYDAATSGLITLQSSSLELTVVSTIDQDVQPTEVADIDPVIDVSDEDSDTSSSRLPLILILSASLTVAVILALRWLATHRSKSNMPKKWAEQQFARLRTSGPFEERQSATIASELSSILRRYLVYRINQRQPASSASQSTRSDGRAPSGQRSNATAVLRDGALPPGNELLDRYINFFDVDSELEQSLRNLFGRFEQMQFSGKRSEGDSVESLADESEDLVHHLDRVSATLPTSETELMTASLDLEDSYPHAANASGIRSS